MTDVERQRDAAEARREAFLPTREAVLEDLFDKLMDGEEYPRAVMMYGAKTVSYVSRINLYTILAEQDGSELAELVNMFMRATLEGEDLARQRVKKIVRAYLEGDGRAWVDMRMQDMAAEAEEEGRE